MIKRIINLMKNVTAQAVNSQSPITFRINDPQTPDLTVLVPPPDKTPLPISVNGYAGGGYQSGTVQGQAAQCMVSLNTTMSYIVNRSPKPMTKWAATAVLKVYPRAGVELNAYYDRKTLKFFYKPEKDKTVYACDSNDIVSHELGHALLDILRPELWTTKSTEVFAFHESFGDMTAILGVMQFDEIMKKALAETGGDMTKSNVISRLAEELGFAVYKEDPNGGNSPLFLRDASNNFAWVNPTTLPVNSPADKLSREPHNFSRVFTGAWYTMLAKIHQNLLASGVETLSALKKARDISCEYLLGAVVNAPVTTRFFDSVAKQILVMDGTAGRPYRDIILSTFNERNILRSVIKAQTESTWEDVEHKICGDHSIVHHAEGYSVRVRKSKSMRLIDHLGIFAQDFNPLYGLDIEIPAEIGYEFDNDGNILETFESSEEELKNDTHALLNYISAKNLVGPNKPFAIVGDKLVRQKILCCNSNPACDPNAPEYGKAWKGANNAGCCGKSITKLNCDCTQPKPTPPKKLGCYTSVKVGAITRHKTGSSVGRKVC